MLTTRCLLWLHRGDAEFAEFFLLTPQRPLCLGGVSSTRQLFCASAVHLLPSSVPAGEDRA